MAKNKKPTKPKPAARTPAKRSPKRTAAAPAPKRTTLPVFHVDAFTSRVFHGNPAAVVLIDNKWPDADLMQSIAAEHNLPMTAFVQRGKGKKFGLRWFNARQEFELCGHATLAAAHVLFTHERVKGTSIVFSTDTGDLPVSRDGDRLVLEFPARPAVRVRITNDLCAALGHEPTEAHVAGSMLLAVFDNKRSIHDMEPDMAKLMKLEAKGIIVTAPAAGHDFVSRYFAPKHGLTEDHATGSSHCTLVPYWADRLSKSHLFAHQVSHRGGELWCELKGRRVLLGGHAVTFGKGSITA